MILDGTDLAWFMSNIRVHSFQIRFSKNLTFFLQTDPLIISKNCTECNLH